MLNIHVRRNTVKDWNRRWTPWVKRVEPWQITLSAARYLSERLFSEHPNPELFPLEHCDSVIADCQAYLILFRLSRG